MGSFHSVGVSDIDYSKPADEFVFAYGAQVFDQPFFNSFTGAATMLSEFMVRLAPGRSAAQIAYFAATARTIGKGIINMDKVMADIEKHKAQGYPVPKIAQGLSNG